MRVVTRARLTKPWSSSSVHTFHRPILQKLLAKHLDADDRIQFAKRMVSYLEPSPTDPITLNFKDGTTATCDFVVGSNGIRSAVRRTMYNGFAEEAEQRDQPRKSRGYAQWQSPSSLARLRTTVWHRPARSHSSS